MILIIGHTEFCNTVQDRMYINLINKLNLLPKLNIYLMSCNKHVSCHAAAHCCGTVIVSLMSTPCKWYHCKNRDLIK